MINALAPFVVAAVVAVLYFWLGGAGTTPAGKAMRRDINFYYAAVLLTAMVSIFGSIRYGKDGMDIATWIVAALAIVAAIGRFKTSPHDGAIQEEKVEQGPLERASDKKR